MYNLNEQSPGHPMAITALHSQEKILFQLTTSGKILSFYI